MSKFYIDFEATQFTQEIISIGCICDNKKYFSTLVKPDGKKNKITKFITELTGITKEMLVDAPSADEAFSQLHSFVNENSDNDFPEFYCYGNSDKGFIEATIKKMGNMSSILFANNLMHSLQDFSTQVKHSFKVDCEVSLKKIYTLIMEEEIVQKHDALEDAIMLSEVASHLKEEYSDEDRIKLSELKVIKDNPYKNRVNKKAPDIWYEWICLHKDQLHSANTNADENKYACYCKTNKRIKYFDSYETAALWAIRFLSVPNRSPKNPDHVKNVVKNIDKAIKLERKYANIRWYK